MLLPAFRDKLIPMQEVDRGERTDQQRFYDQLDIAFLVLGYVRRGARIAKAERQYKSEREYAITLPNQTSNLVPLLLTGSFPGFERGPRNMSWCDSHRTTEDFRSGFNNKNLVSVTSGLI